MADGKSSEYTLYPQLPGRKYKSPRKLTIYYQKFNFMAISIGYPPMNLSNGWRVKPSKFN
jgi:hypothetical protein